MGAQIFFGITEACELSLNDSLFFEPLLALHRELLLFVLELILQLKDRLAQVFHLPRQLSYLILILLLRVIA